MNVLQLADELDTKFGNPLGPKRYALIKEAVAVLRQQAEEIQKLKEAQKK